MITFRFEGTKYELTATREKRVPIVDAMIWIEELKPEGGEWMNRDEAEAAGIDVEGLEYAMQCEGVEL